MSALNEVRAYWDQQSCGTGVAVADKHSLDYFEQIEEFRYRIEPEIFAFAQFTRYKGQKLLEVGVGAGTDFLQWCRAGAEAHGVDLTQEAIENVTHRLARYGLNAADLRTGNAEALPYPDGTFDVVYSWGVIHHSPDTPKALSELARVTRIGGTIKIMVYNRHSLHTFYWWIRHALLRGRPWRSFADVLHHHMESIGTKSYTRAEISAMAEERGLTVKYIDTTVSPFYDLLVSRPQPLPFIAYALAAICGFRRSGFFLRAEMIKARERG